MNPPTDRSERRRRWREGMLIFLVAVAFLVLAVVQTRLPEFTNSASRSGNIIFFLLINLNIIILVLFIFLVARNLVKLVVEQRQRIFGARLRARLVIAFVTLTLFPTALLFVVAEGFLSEAINKWFSSRVESTVDSAVTVAHRYYQRAADDALHYGIEIGEELRRRDLLEPGRRERLRNFIENEREDFNVQAIQVIDASGPLAQVRVEALEERALRVAINEQRLALEEGLDFTRTLRIADGDLVRAGVPVHGADDSVVAVVVVDYVVPSVISEAVRETARTHDEYRQLGVLKQPIVNSYTLTLLLITMVVLLAAIWFGFTFAKGFTVPIQALGEGMREVAQGNLNYRAEAGGDQEFAPLFDSFNQMAGELQTAHAELDERRGYIENVLRNITAGVLSVDEDGIVATMNPAAGSMLNVVPAEVSGRPWRQLLDLDELAPLAELLSEVLSGSMDRIERQVELVGSPRTLTAWVTAIKLEDELGVARGAILFLEDVSYLLRVERMEAWREVARRIAHEIKNPLTPIQLSAQRLQKRYGEELGPEKGAVLEECTSTIVGQVEQLKKLVNEFSTFARLPAVEVSSHDLAEVLEDAVVLYREGHDDVEFDMKLEDDVPAVEIDPEAIKRVIVNLLDNAVSACEGVDAPRVELSLHHDRQSGFVHLEVADNGSGMTPQVRRRIFEPYFSTKSDGTGLGLAIVATIIAEHRAYVRVRENEPSGTRFVIDFPVRAESRLPAALRA